MRAHSILLKTNVPRSLHSTYFTRRFSSQKIRNISFLFHETTTFCIRRSKISRHYIVFVFVPFFFLLISYLARGSGKSDKKTYEKLGLLSQMEQVQIFLSLFLFLFRFFSSMSSGIWIFPEWTVGNFSSLFCFCFLFFFFLLISYL